MSRFSSLPAELHATRLSSFAKFSGATIPRRKPPGNERKTYGKTTRTYFLANPNLEGEIHLKGGRFVTSQFSIWMLYIDHSYASMIYSFLLLCFSCILIQETLSNSRTNLRELEVSQKSNFDLSKICNWIKLFFSKFFSKHFKN